MLFPLNNPTDKIIEYKHGRGRGGYQKNIYMYLEKKGEGDCKFCIDLFIKQTDRFSD